MLLHRAIAIRSAPRQSPRAVPRAQLIRTSARRGLDLTRDHARRGTMMAELPEKVHFPAEEEKIQELWDRLDAFKTSLKLSEGKPEVRPHPFLAPSSIAS